MRAVFDLDDTISRHKNRDFANAEPIVATIEKIRQLKEDGWEIVIYSARGQNSCKGDLELIEKRNRGQVETWLQKHSVPYDELRFGKPLGDIYVDDKGVSLLDFLAGKYEKLKGNSGSEIYRAGNTVYKTCKDAAAQAEWYRQARELGVKVPEVYSVVLNTISMEHIAADDGKIEKRQLYSLVSTVMLFSLKRAGYKFEPEALIRRAEEHLETYNGDANFENLWSYIRGNTEEYRKAASFCHGDLSLSNVIISGGEAYLIDPIISEEYSSYLLDFAKLRFSMDDGEKFLHGESPDYTALLSEMDEILSQNGLAEKIKALEAIYWLRLLKYTESPVKKHRAVAKAKALEAEL